MSARRCRDLWFGSELLSTLAKAAAKAIQEEIKASDSDEDPLIFPNAQSVERDDGSVANKIVVRIPNGSAKRCQEIAEAGKAAMKAKLNEIAKDIFDDIEKAAKGSFQREDAEKQIETCMEYMWVAVPERDGAYVSARQRGEELLAARKNTRDWEQLIYAKFGIPKSSLDGVRESVIHENVYDRREKREFLPINQRHRIYGVKGEERLCGIGLLKRKGRIDVHAQRDELPIFHSAAHIASAGVRRRIAQSLEGDNRDQVLQAYTAWHQALSEHLGAQGLNDITIRVDRHERTWRSDEDIATPFALPRDIYEEVEERGYDGVTLYPQRLKELLGSYQDDAFESNNRRLKSDAKALEKPLRKLLRSVGVSDEPYPYYVMLAADGDKMGAAIQQIQTAEEHRNFSQRLDERFAQQAGSVIRRHGGTLIFAGGDDVLALLPACTALQAARGLRNLFKAAMVNQTDVDENNNTKSPTLSVGLALAHFMTPFAEVRALAKEAEQLAKQSGRNRLAILWDKRSGTTRSVVGEWKDAPMKEADVLDLDLMDQRILAMAAWLESGGIPRSFAHHLLEVLDIVGPSAATRAQLTEEALTDTENDMLLSLARRVIERRPVDDKYKEQFAEFLEHANKKAKNAAEAIQSLAHELLLANEFRKARVEAGLDMSLRSTHHKAKEAAE